MLTQFYNFLKIVLKMTKWRNILLSDIPLKEFRPKPLRTTKLTPSNHNPTTACPRTADKAVLILGLTAHVGGYPSPAHHVVGSFSRLCGFSSARADKEFPLGQELLLLESQNHRHRVRGRVRAAAHNGTRDVDTVMRPGRAHISLSYLCFWVTTVTKNGLGEACRE